MARTTYCILLDVEHDDDVDVSDLIDRLLDDGIPQDALKERAADDGGEITVISAWQGEPDDDEPEHGSSTVTLGSVS